jgi:hypothetical protein
LGRCCRSDPEKRTLHEKYRICRAVGVSRKLRFIFALGPKAIADLKAVAKKKNGFTSCKNCQHPCLGGVLGIFPSMIKSI